MGVEKLPRFAAIVPVSPKPEDARRVQQLVASLVHWEPSVAWCVIVDDCLESRALSELSGLP
jgi:hypothetical protein